MNKLKWVAMFYVGFTSYITIEVLFRGYSYPLMGLIGALSFIIIGNINNKISWNIDLIIQGLIGCFVITLFEFIVGELDIHLLHINMWNYNNQIGNIDGVICPLFSFIWFFIAILCVLLADFIDYYLLNGSDYPYYKILNKIIYPFKRRK